MPNQVVSVFGPGRRLLTAGLILTVTLVAFESLAIATVMPSVEADLGDLQLYGWVFSAFFLGSLVGIVIAGRLADAVHPVVPFLIGLVVFGAGLVVGGLAQSMLMLVFGRALQGLGGGALPAIAYVCIGRAYPSEIRPRMFALLSTAWVVPALLGPTLAKALADALTWHWVFLGLLPLLAVCGTMAVLGVRRLEAPDELSASRGASLWDAALVAVGGGCLLAGLDRADLVSATALVVVGLALGVPALRRLTPPGTLRAKRGVPTAVLTKGTLTFAFFAADAYIPLAFETVRDTSGAVVLTAGAVFWTAGSWTQERFVRRVGPRRLVTIGFALIATGVLTTMGVLFTSVSPYLGVVTWGIAGFGIGIGYAPLALTVLAGAEAGTEGAATSGMQLCDTLGSALGTGAAGALVAIGARVGWDVEPGIALVYGLALTMALLGLVIARRLPRLLGA